MAADEFSWDDPIRSYLDTWREVVFSPRSFFSEERLAADHGVQDAVGFLLISLLIGGVGLLLGGWGFWALPVLLVGGLVRVLIAALVICVIATQVFDGRGNYESTVRVLAYASAMAVFVFVPRLRIVAKLYGLFLATIGLRQAHRLSPASAVLTLLTSALVAFALHVALRGCAAYPFHSFGLLR